MNKRPQWETVPPSEGCIGEWHLRAGRIRAVVRLHQGTYYYGISYGGSKPEFGSRAYTATEQTAKMRAEDLLAENIKPIVDYWNALPVSG
jgi:hypothetical protein